jgi:uncharacterized protein
MSAAVASAARTFDKLKVLLDGIESEWTDAPETRVATDVSRNHRPADAEHLEESRAPSADSHDELYKLSSGERRILTALTQYPQGRSKAQTAILAGYALSGGGFRNYLGALRSRGFIKGDRDRLRITDAGIEALGSWEPPPTGPALVDYWRGQLGKAERLILDALTEAYPDALSKEEVAVRAGYEANGGGFRNALGRLRTLELIQGRGEIRASENLFDGR